MFRSLNMSTLHAGPQIRSSFVVEEVALGLTKSQDLLLQLLLALPMLAVHVTRTKQPDKETPSTMNPALTPSSPRAPGSTSSMETNMLHDKVLSSPLFT